MDTLKFSSIADILDKNEVEIVSNLQKESSGQTYFKQFTSGSLAPGKIVSETFVGLLKLSIRMGNSSSLTEQYQWTKSMLGSRGIDTDSYMRSFLHFIDLVGGVVERYTNSKDELIICKELFQLLKEEFIETVKEQ